MTEISILCAEETLHTAAMAATKSLENISTFLIFLFVFHEIFKKSFQKKTPFLSTLGDTVYFTDLNSKIWDLSFADYAMKEE